MIVVLAGGVGAARFLRGLTAVAEGHDVTVIANVGDDIDVHGLRICPDLDSIAYWLSGLVHPNQQWGRADERFTVREELARFGHQSWFTLGDRDLATHLHRSALLAQDVPLSDVTRGIAEHLGLEVRLLPVSDDRIETRIHTTDGRDLHFQEWWVRDRAVPDVRNVEFRGVETATPAPGVLEAMMTADAVIIAPSNPVVSIWPIIEVPGVRDALTRTSARVIGISPIVGGRVVRGMAHRLLPAVGCGVDAAEVAFWYGSRDAGGLLDGWVLDTADAASIDRVNALGIDAVATDTMLDDPVVAARLATTVLDLSGSLSTR